jgi:hypothetical protein
LLAPVKIISSLCPAFLAGFSLLALRAGSSSAQIRNPAKAQPETDEVSRARDREIEARFAPVFHQGLGDKPRNDYVANFDFDGDWRGDNNWANSAGEEFPEVYVHTPLLGVLRR